jgi:hypothetical protein
VAKEREQIQMKMNCSNKIHKTRGTGHTDCLNQCLAGGGLFIKLEGNLKHRNQTYFGVQHQSSGQTNPTSAQTGSVLQID